jgi:hypothetical protein
LRELGAIETLRRVWVQHYHASEQGTPWRADGELPPSAILMTSPSDTEARYSRKKSTAWTGYKVHFTQTGEADAPHLIVEVIPTSATMADGEIVGELHAHLDEQHMLPAQHWMEMGYVDAEVLAECKLGRKDRQNSGGKTGIPEVSSTGRADVVCDRGGREDAEIYGTCNHLLLEAKGLE